jgi:single-stranded-DNA-specific exonuclease
LPPTSKRWNIAPRAPAEHFDRCPDLPPLVVQVLYNRNVSELAAIEDFIAGRWHDDDPWQLLGMGQAVERLEYALKRGDKVAIYGDYDADGVTATVLMMQVLTALGGRAQAYIPNRFDEGYGLNREALAELAGQGVKVVLTVDCGIRSVAEVAYGNTLGLDIIITDHHQLAESDAGQDLLPPALAVINPRQLRCPYPFKDLAGVGLAYKLAQALLRSAKNNDNHRISLDEADLLDLVALGTVADIVPLVQENRMLVTRGLASLNQAKRPGLLALMDLAGTQPGKIRSGTIGYVLGPRLNAAGRLDSALAAYRTLATDNPGEARRLATFLENQNRERQQLTMASVEKARRVIMAEGDQRPLYFLSDRDFNQGIVGLVASRLAEEFYRPALVAERGDTQTKGSARSIPEFHITRALDQCADLLLRYGGHAAAAGFTLENDKVPEFTARLDQIAGEALDQQELVPTLSVDAAINLRGVTFDLVRSLNQLQPFGHRNPTPCFVTYGMVVKAQRVVGKESRHLKLTLHDGKGVWDAIAFRQSAWAGHLPARIDVAYNLDVNEWNGQQRLQLKVKDIKPATEA